MGDSDGGVSIGQSQTMAFRRDGKLTLHYTGAREIETVGSSGRSRPSTTESVMIDYRDRSVDARVAINIRHVNVVHDTDAVVVVSAAAVGAIIAASVPRVITLIWRERHPTNVPKAEPDTGRAEAKECNQSGTPVMTNAP